MIKHLLATCLPLVTFVTLAAGAPAWAAQNCGDTAAAGARVACACGDTVITSTSLKAGDPVVNAVCPGIGLTIGADDIVLNCNSRQVSGDPSGNGIALIGRTGVTVRGCALTGFRHGIFLSASSGNTLLSNSVSETAEHGIALDEGSRGNLLKSNRIVGPGNDGINLGTASSGNTLLTNTLDAAEISLGDGIDLDEFDAGGNTVKGNQISGFSVGIEVSSEGNTITENVSRRNGNQGILLFAGRNTVARNTLEENEGEGLWVMSDGNTITGNVSRGNETGLLVEPGNGNSVAGNTARSNGFEGLVVSGDGNTVDGNHSLQNGSVGLAVLGSGNAVTRNTTDGNGVDTDDDGIFVEGDGNTIDMNHGKANTLNGLEVQGTGNLVKRNAFDNNGAFGICVATGNLDGGGNHAAGNGAGDISFACDL